MDAVGSIAILGVVIMVAAMFWLVHRLGEYGPIRNPRPAAKVTRRGAVAMRWNVAVIVIGTLIALIGSRPA
jgi:flagellar biogenesis protein FliO